MRFALPVALVLSVWAGAASAQVSATKTDDATVTLTPKQARKYRQAVTDWPDLARYRAENAKLAAPSAEEQRVVFFGDSITDFWGRKYGKFFPGKPYVNRGIGGQTTPQMLIRFQQDVLALQPSAVIVLAGINDIAGNTGPTTTAAIEDNFRSMITLAKAAHVRVILCSVLPVSGLPWNPSVHPTGQILELNQWLEQTAKAEHLVFANYYPALVNDHDGMKENLAFDKAVHPNDAGYALMEPIASEAIAKSLAMPRP